MDRHSHMYMHAITKASNSNEPQKPDQNLAAAIAELARLDNRATWNQHTNNNMWSLSRFSAPNQAVIAATPVQEMGLQQQQYPSPLPPS
jgi:hypothetical protein